MKGLSRNLLDERKTELSNNLSLIVECYHFILQQMNLHSFHAFMPIFPTGLSDTLDTPGKAGLDSVIIQLYTS